MRNIFYIFILIGIVALCGCSDDDKDPFNPDHPTIMLSPDEIEAGAGDEFSLKVEIAGVTDLFGATFDVTFDQTKVDAQEEGYAEAGDFLGSSTVFMAMDEPDRVSVGISRVQTEANDGESGNGVLAIIRLKAVSDQPSEITITNVKLVTETGVDVYDFENLVVLNASLNE